MGKIFQVKHEKYWNLLWSGLTVVLALDAIQTAIEYGEIDTFFYFLIHLVIAVLFLTRHRPKTFSDRPAAYLVAVLSTNYFFLYETTSLEATRWGPVGMAVTVAGSVVCLLSVLSLGKCFGVLPIYRGLQFTRMYRFIRHPIYASYVVMDGGLLLANFSIWNVFVLSTGIYLFLVRIQYEEQLLSQNRDYRDYQKRTPFKLIPGLL